MSDLVHAQRVNDFYLLYSSLIPEGWRSYLLSPGYSAQEKCFTIERELVPVLRQYGAYDDVKYPPGYWAPAVAAPIPQPGVIPAPIPPAFSPLPTDQFAAVAPPAPLVGAGGSVPPAVMPVLYGATAPPPTMPVFSGAATAPLFVKTETPVTIPLAPATSPLVGSAGLDPFFGRSSSAAPSHYRTAAPGSIPPPPSTHPFAAGPAGSEKPPKASTMQRPRPAGMAAPATDLHGVDETRPRARLCAKGMACTDLTAQHRDQVMHVCKFGNQCRMMKRGEPQHLARYVHVSSISELLRGQVAPQRPQHDSTE